MQFPEKLRALMDERGLNQTQLAVRSGVSTAAISHFLTGRRRPSGDILLKLATGLGVTPGALLGNDTDEVLSELMGLKQVDTLVRLFTHLPAADQERVLQFVQMLAETSGTKK